MTKTVHVAGKRKRAVARVTLKEGKGRIRIYSQLLDTFEKGYVKDKIMEPVVLAGEIVKKIDFNIIDTEISDELGQYLKSGVGVPFSIKGKVIIGLQSKVKYSIFN